MADDDLSAPLGQRLRKKPRFALPVSIPQIIAGALGLCVATFAGWTLLADDPFGGEPMTVVSATGRKAEPAAKPPETSMSAHDTPAGVTKTAEPKPADPKSADPKSPSGTQTVTIIDGSTGKRQEVVVGGNEKKGADDRSAPKAAAGIDPRLLETTRHGAIPKIGADGARAADVYARPAQVRAGQPDGPRVAIVVSGLGIGAGNTTQAFAKMPAAVTFAFTPYGSDLERWVMRARGEGHEVLLQVGMEPFDYPDNDPGPQTLLASATMEQNTDRLHWFMSRFQGYVGVTNLMGARFTAHEPALAPMLREIAKRGLIYVDDGSSPRSLAATVSGAANTAFAKADVIIDAAPSSAQIDAALAKLEATARSRGIAVGSVSALPVAIERVAQWIKAAEARGITIVPISAVAVKPKSS